MRLNLDDAELDRLAQLVAQRVPRYLPAAEVAPERFLSLSDVAKLIGAGTRKALEMRLVRARQRGELHPLERMTVMIDGQRRWPEAAVLAWAKGSR